MSNPLVSISNYLPERDALLIHVDMSRYLLDYYIHRKEYAAATESSQDDKLKELIACFAIHLTLRQPEETHAWTLHLIAEQPFSLFVTGSARPMNDQQDGFIVGHVLTEHIRHTDVNSFHAQLTDNSGKIFRSYLRSETAEISEMVEHFYQQSEQLPLRIMLSQTSDEAVALAALPGFDEEWFRAVPMESLEQATLEKKPMRTFKFNFACDCSPEKLLPFFRSIDQGEIDELYGEDKELMISCPRCGRRFPIHRTDITP